MPLTSATPDGATLPTNPVKIGEHFPTEAAMFEHLLRGGIIRPHFKADETNQENWIVLKDGNRVKFLDGSSAANYLLGTGYWVNAGYVEDERTEIAALDAALARLGMIPLTTMLKRPEQLMPFHGHKGVDNLVQFEKWLTMRHKECLKMKTRFIVEGKGSDDMYEWVLAHSAAFTEAMINFKQADLGSNKR